MKIYISGPMTGLPDFNYPAFNAAADALTKAGHQPINPADAPERETWLDYMRHDLTLLAQADAIASLPGWGNSRGAGIEHAIAAMLGLPAKSLDDWLKPSRLKKLKVQLHMRGTDSKASTDMALGA